MTDKNIFVTKAYPNSHEIHLTIGGVSLEITKEEAIRLLKNEISREIDTQILPTRIHSAKSISMYLSQEDREQLTSEISKFLALVNDA